MVTVNFEVISDIFNIKSVLVDIMRRNDY